MISFVRIGFLLKISCLEKTFERLGFEVTFNPPCKMGLTGLHHTAFFIVWLSRVCLCDMRGGFCRFRSVIVVVLFKNASFS